MLIVQFHEFIFASVLNIWIFFVFSFAILGAGVKYIDSAFDENTFSKKKALLLAPFLGVFYAFLMSLNANAATILMSFLVGVFLSGKINNLAFYIQTAFWAIFVFIFGNVSIFFFPFIMLVVASIIDEKGNDLSDARKLKTKIARFVFKHRLFMDVVAFLLAVFGFIELVFLVSFFAFDLGYSLVGTYSKKLKSN